MNREQKIEALIKYDINNLCVSFLKDVLRNGFDGYSNLSDQEIDELYEELPL